MSLRRYVRTGFCFVARPYPQVKDAPTSFSFASFVSLVHLQGQSLKPMIGSGIPCVFPHDRTQFHAPRLNGFHLSKSLFSYTGWSASVDVEVDGKQLWLSRVEIKTKVATSMLGNAVQLSSADTEFCQIEDEVCRKYIRSQNLVQVV